MAGGEESGFFAVSTFLEIVSPSYLLFPALLGTVIMGLVSPMVGSYLVLRRTVFLGLTLPEIAAAGVSFTFWLRQTGFLPQLGQGEHNLAMIGSLVFTFLGMGLLGYLEQRGKGLAEGRLAAAYALAGALTILFVVFNPAGQIEVLDLLKGEVIALSRSELRLLAMVFSLVFLAMVVFRREFLLVSFDRDLAFLLKGRQVIWDVLLYLLAGLVIAFGVIMAGPLLLFGFLVLPALAARPLVKGMISFLCLSSLFGVLMAFFGFYLSIRIDLPLGPTDVALGCGMIFLAHLLRAVPLRAAAVTAAIASIFVLAGCAAHAPPAPFPQVKEGPLWLPKPRNNTNLNLILPEANPLRSLAEMVGKISPDSRATVMDVLREELEKELARRGFKQSYPEQTDKRLASFPFATEAAVNNARQAKLTGLLFLSDILRWNADSKQFISVVADFKLLRIADGAVLWERRYQRAVPTPSATNLSQASSDAVKIIVRDLFRS
jgi:ABC-type Mn2+/Zn2+ transport system permease subunit